MKPIFDNQSGIIFFGNTAESWKLFGINMLGGLTIIAWAAFWSCLTFGCLKWLNILRVSGYDEYYGLDLTHHGEAAYPAGGWVEEQYQNDESDHAGPVGNATRHMENRNELNTISGVEHGNQLSTNTPKNNDNATNTRLPAEYSLTTLNRKTGTKPSATNRSSKLTKIFS